MRKVYFSYSCMAIAQGSLDLPDEVKDGEELAYIREHLGEAPSTDLEWIGDIDPEDAVEQDDIRYIEGERDSEEEDKEI